jgi:hypothetical protein
MARSPTLPSWPELIREACWLWLRIGQAGSDHEAGREDLIFAMDASVASLYAAPARNIENVRLLGMLADETLPDLAHVLGDLFIRKCLPAGGAVLLPGHDEEFLNVFSAVQRDRRSKFSQAPDIDSLLSQSRFSKELRRLDRLRLNPVESNVNFIARDFEILHGILQTEEFDIARWHEFLTRSKVRPLVSDSLALPRVDMNGDRFLDGQDLWFSAIRHEKHSWTPSVLVEYDAEALSSLGEINRLLLRAKDPRRVVLFTLDEAIQTAARKQPSLPGASFVRDPRQFLRYLPSNVGEFLLEDPQPNTQKYSVYEWAKILLSPFLNAGEAGTQYIRQLAITSISDPIWRPIVNLFDRPSMKGTDRLGYMYEEWNQIVRLGVNRYALSYMRHDRRLRTISDFVRGGDQEGLRESLARYVLETVSDASVSSLVAGLYMSLRRRDQHRRGYTTRRMPIALRYDPAQVIDFIEFMNRAVAQKDPDQIPRIGDFANKYWAHLYYGVYFAAVGDWDATDTLATTALALADGQKLAGLGIDQEPNDQRDITGNEAAYLAAVAHRHLVKNPRDLAQARRSLDVAVVRRKRHGKKRGADARFTVERVALDLMKLYAVHFLGPAWDARGPRPRPDDLLSRLAQATNECASETDEVFIRIVRKQILSNILAVGLYDRMIARSGMWRRPIFEEALLELDNLVAGFKAGSGLERAAQSRYVEILIGFWHWMLGHQADLDSLSARLAEAEADPEMPYDKEKYGWMRRRLTARNGDKPESRF